jgi:HK97 family phage portal protein
VDYNRSFFANAARPSGYFETPEEISQDQADAIKAAWDSNTGTSSGKVAVLENGLKYTPLAMKSSDAQMLETLKWNQEDIARAFGVPAWLIGAGTEPTATNAELRMRGYYSQCLQVRIEAIELLLDEALGFLDKPAEGIEFDLEPLLRMDTKTRYEAHKVGIGSAFMTPNEARAKEGLRPKKGGDALYLQQQNYSLEALAKRDAKPDPFASAAPKPAPGADKPDDEPDAEQDATADDVDKALTAALQSAFAPLA